MISFAKRRTRHATLAAIFVLAVIGAALVYEEATHRGAYLTGWTLLGLTAILVLYQIRKRVTTLPIGKASSWLQLHVYLGLSTLILFFVHIDWRMPTGWFETTFGLIFFLVALSGLVGQVLNRWLPARLRRRGEEVLYERIGQHGARLRGDAERVMEACAADTASAAVQEFYFSRMAPFMAAPRNRWAHLFGLKGELTELLEEIETLHRYLNPKDQQYLDDLKYIACKKDELDFHYALQGALKHWSFVHVPLTYAVLLGLPLHLVVVYAFNGGLG